LTPAYLHHGRSFASQALFFRKRPLAGITWRTTLSQSINLVIVHHKDAKDSKTPKESSLKDTTFANLGVLCAFAVHKRLYGERLLNLLYVCVYIMLCAGGSLFFEKLRVELPGAVGAYAVREGGGRMLLNIHFDLLPIALVIPDLLAARTNRDEPPQGLDFVHGPL